MEELTVRGKHRIGVVLLWCVNSEGQPAPLLKLHLYSIGRHQQRILSHVVKR
jgi:hypothetical protein